MPSGLQESEKLERPLFTPSTKAEQGEHDENIHPDRCIPNNCHWWHEVKELIGEEKASKIEKLAVALYFKVSAKLIDNWWKAAQYAESRGIIIADTKFEFGENENGEIILIDEVLTPGLRP